MMKICIVGMGNMGRSMFNRFSGKSGYEVFGCDKEDDIKEIALDADIILIAVKPQEYSSLDLGELGDKIVISIMAGVTLSTIKGKISTTKYVRVMPNLALKVGGAFSGWYSEGLSDQDKETVRDILRCFGEQMEVKDEAHVDMITALSGSGPAYYYYFNRAFKNKAIAMGFTEDEARKIARGTFLGAAKLLDLGETGSDELVSRITSAGGTTEAAIKVLDEKGLEAIVAEAIDAAVSRAVELDKVNENVEQPVAQPATPDQTGESGAA